MTGKSLAAALAAMSAGCALPQSSVPTPYPLLHASREPAQYRSANPRDIQGSARDWPEATGVACRTMLSWPTNPPTPFLGSATAASLLPWPSFDVTWGNDGYAKAVKMALGEAAGGSLVDVRADVHTVAVLGIYRRECIEIHALVAR